jgi:hypothetical protein
VFAWMPIAWVRLSIWGCLCHDSFLICRCYLTAGKIARLLTPALMNLFGWLKTLSLVRHGRSECVGVTIGGHKVSPVSNHTVMQPHHSPESIGDLYQIAACLVYTAKTAHFMYCGHLMAHDRWGRPC